MTSKDWLAQQIDDSVKQMNNLSEWKQTAIRIEFENDEYEYLENRKKEGQYIVTSDLQVK